MLAILRERAETKHILLACYCPSDEMCHRSIVYQLALGGKTMFFKDEYAFLSNMYECPVTLHKDDVAYTFKCAEAAFQACKCPSRFHEFINLDGYQAKRLGRQVPLRPDWEEIKLNVMKAIVALKFYQNPMLAVMLKDIKEDIVENNTWNDTFWGVCNGVGENHLGEILMEIRDTYVFYLLVAGSRGYTNYDEMCSILDYLLQNQVAQGRKIVIVSGGAKGADTLAERYADERGYEKHIMPAKWYKEDGTYDNSAGYRRNKEMHTHIAIPSGNKRGCVCFWDMTSPGTKHNFQLAKQYGNPLKVYDTIHHRFLSEEEIQQYT